MPGPGLLLRLCGVQVLLQSRDLAVQQAGGLPQVTVALGAFGLRAQVVDLRLEVTHAVESGLLGLPPRVEGIQLGLLVRLVLAQSGQTFDGRGVCLPVQGQFLHGQAVHGAAQLVDLLRGGIDLHAQPGRGLVNQVDGLVRELTAGDVTLGQLSGGNEGRVRDLHLVVRLVTLLQPAQDRHGVLDRGLPHVDLLEPTLQGGVLLDVLAVLVQRGGTDQAQLTAGQHGLEHVARVHGPLGRTRAHDRVDLVDERDDLTLGLLDLVQDGLEAFLELPAVLGAGHHGPQVQGDQGLAAQRLGYVPGHHALGEALDHGGLTHTGLTDQHGVVLGPAREHLDHAADLRVTPDHGIELPLAGDRREVRAELLEGLEGPLRVRAGDPAVTAHLRDGLCERLRGHARSLQRLGGLVASRGQTVEQVLGGDVLVLEFTRVVLRSLQCLQRGAAQLGLGRRGPGCAGHLVDDVARLDGHGVRVGTGGL